MVSFIGDVSAAFFLLVSNHQKVAIFNPWLKTKESMICIILQDTGFTGKSKILFSSLKANFTFYPTLQSYLGCSMVASQHLNARLGSSSLQQVSLLNFVLFGASPTD